MKTYHDNTDERDSMSEANPKTPEQELISERIDRAAAAFARALLKHPLLSTMIRKQMSDWHIPTVVEGNTEAMVDAVALHLHWQRAGVQRMSDADLGHKLREGIVASGTREIVAVDEAVGRLARVLLGAGRSS